VRAGGRVRGRRHRSHPCEVGPGQGDTDHVGGVGGIQHEVADDVVAGEGQGAVWCGWQPHCRDTTTRRRGGRRCQGGGAVLGRQLLFLLHHALPQLLHVLADGGDVRLLERDRTRAAVAVTLVPVGHAVGGDAHDAAGERLHHQLVKPGCVERTHRGAAHALLQPHQLRDAREGGHPGVRGCLIGGARPSAHDWW